MTFEIDSFDDAILKIVAGEGRISVTNLAQRINLSKSPTQARLRRLEKDGIIKGYTAQFDAAKLGLSHTAFVEVKLADTREASLNAFNKAVLTIPEIEQCHMIAGGFDYLLKVRTSDMRSYRRVLGERISALPNVAHTSTHVVMEDVKDDGPSDV